jgi:histone H3/H4
MASRDSDNNPSSSPRSSRLGPRSQQQATTPRTVATPIRRALSAEPATGGRLSASARRTAAVAATTPHGRAALRELNQRRTAAFTPGRTRRRSVREQRETPRDILRNLSRVLAPASTTVRTSSSSSPPEPNPDEHNLRLVPGTRAGNVTDDDDDFLPERPRFSLPLVEEDDDDDSELRAPRLSGLEDENYTVQSVELPRRAVSELARDRFDRTSLASLRFSDYAGRHFGDEEAAAIDSGFFPPPDLDDDTTRMVLEEGDTLERLDAEEGRRQTLGRVSDVFGEIEVPQLGEESTFVMAPAEPTVTEPIQFDGLEEEEPVPDEDADVLRLDNVGDEPSELPALDDEDPTLETILSRTVGLGSKTSRRLKSGKRMSRYDIEYSRLPQGVVKRLAITFAKTAGVGNAKLGPDTMAAIMQTTDWFFEQLGDDLKAYAEHAGRRTIEESDVIALMRR